ncbi:MAG TPA: NAD(P)-dependent oxidoreductase [Acidimicrobiia bacterium]|nr:NAD(P)-dependent oxidoreductase [Acidimicrobiia bacterium]
MTDRLGFAGMGIMGSGMASNLIARGHPLTVWNRTRAKAEAIHGAEVAETLEDLAGAVDIIMICVSDSSDVVAVVEGGLLPGLRDGQLIVDHSTISPAVTRDLAAQVAARGVGWIDAPVSGGSEGARKGTLSTMVGGSIEDLARVRPFLESYSTTITHVGPIGSGQLVKLVNQILVVGNQMAVSEALMFARRAGLDLEATLNAVKGGAAGSWMLANRGPQMIADDWRPGFTIDLQQKDLRLVLDAADDLGAPLPATGLIFQLYRALQASGHGHEGNHALIKALEQMTGNRGD